MTFRPLILFSTICAVALGCSRDKYAPDASYTQKVELELQSGMRTKAHFEDNSGTASFVWDVGNSMMAVLAHQGKIVQWEGGTYTSPMNITLIDPSDKHYVRRATSQYSIPSSAAEAEDKLFFLSPVYDSELSTAMESDSEVAVSITMPNNFSQSASGRLEEFADYTFIRGESSIKSVPSGDDKNYAANPTTFRAIPATFRFNVTNNTESDITMESIKISCNKLFPNKLCWSSDGSTISISEPEDKSGYFKTIQTLIDSGFGELIPAKTGESASKASYYAMCLPYDNAESLASGTLSFILETKKKVHTFNVSTEEFFKSSPIKKFESNKIYNFNFLMNDNSVELEEVNISDWTGDAFYLPTEEISATLDIRTTYWVQDRENLFTYAFIRMIGNDDHYTMWSECNIGEYLYSSSDVQLTWSDIVPKDESDENYLSEYFNDITDFKWKTPTREDYQALFNPENTNIEIVKDEESGVFGLYIKRKDDSKSAIFLPSYGKVEEVTDYSTPGTTITTRTYHGRYWTKDAKDDTNAYYIHFAFKQVQTVIGGQSSTFSPFEKVLNQGNDFFEIRDTLKTKFLAARAILQK